MIEWPVSKNVTQVKSFLGFVNFFHDSLQNLVEVSARLIRLAKKDVGWQWTKVDLDTFKQIKQLVTSAPGLALVDLVDQDIALTISTDSSKIAAGGSFLVENDESYYLVAYYCRKFTDVEQRYSTTDREMLAIVDNLRQFNRMLLGRTFKLFTDHKSLTIYFTKNRQPNSREARWKQELCQFQSVMQLKYIAGKENILVDALNRHPDYEIVEVRLV